MIAAISIFVLGAAVIFLILYIWDEKMSINKVKKKLTYQEVEALLFILNEIEKNGDQLTEIEKSARETLKRIYAAQIAAHNRKDDNNVLNVLSR